MYDYKQNRIISNLFAALGIILFTLLFVVVHELGHLIALEIAQLNYESFFLKEIIIDSIYCGFGVGFCIIGDVDILTAIFVFFVGPIAMELLLIYAYFKISSDRLDKGSIFFIMGFIFVGSIGDILSFLSNVI